MKKLLFILSNLLILACLAQNPTKVLFIGNSFTYANNMPVLFKEMADSAHISVITGMHAPGGVTVGDTAQGTMAHMNNPALFALIRSQKWEYVVIQDNQGRFVEDSAVFPSKSKVVQGHLNIMDSVKANNSCAKIILFAGWGWKNGYPQLSNTGIGIINRILVNYVVLNDTMKEIVAPIGEAWKKVVNYLPSVNLWDADDAHPSYSGSYLTAAVIFSTIFEKQTKTINYNGSLNPTVAFNLRAFSDSAVFNSTAKLKYNLGGIETITPQYNNGQLSVQGNYADYNWYKNNVLVGNSANLVLSGNGDYQAVVTENDGCILKSCIYSHLITGFSKEMNGFDINVFPNPVMDGLVTITSDFEFEKIELMSVSGQTQKINIEYKDGTTKVSAIDAKKGCYFLILTSATKTMRKKIIVLD